MFKAADKRLSDKRMLDDDECLWFWWYSRFCK
jgi:hypothetical protein